MDNEHPNNHYNVSDYTEEELRMALPGAVRERDWDFITATMCPYCGVCDGYRCVWVQDGKNLGVCTLKVMPKGGFGLFSDENELLLWLDAQGVPGEVPSE